MRATHCPFSPFNPIRRTVSLVMASGQIDRESIYVIAGFVAYVNTCSPASMRIKSEYLKGVLEEKIKISDRQGVFPALPPELAGESLTELLTSGKINLDIDQKYPQAIGINLMLEHTSLLGNFWWDVIINPMMIAHSLQETFLLL